MRRGGDEGLLPVTLSGVLWRPLRCNKLQPCCHMAGRSFGERCVVRQQRRNQMVVVQMVVLPTPGGALLQEGCLSAVTERPRGEAACYADEHPPMEPPGAIRGGRGWTEPVPGCRAGQQTAVAARNPTARGGGVRPARGAFLPKRGVLVGCCSGVRANGVGVPSVLAGREGVPPVESTGWFSNFGFCTPQGRSPGLYIYGALSSFSPGPRPVHNPIRCCAESPARFCWSLQKRAKIPA